MLNQIYCEDCLEGLKKIPDNSVDLVIIDPPYEMAKKCEHCGEDRISKGIKKVHLELAENSLINGFDPRILDELMRVMKKVNIYIWCNGKQIPNYIKYFVLTLKCKLEIIIWGKTNAMPLFNNKYLNDKEYCLYFRNGGYCNPNNYEDARTIYFSTTNIKDKTKYGHPTIKPLSLIRKMVRNSSKENDTVLDCFLGSGTTAIACILENRNYIGFEKNKEYFKICQKRIEEAYKERNDVNVNK